MTKFTALFLGWEKNQWKAEGTAGSRPAGCCLPWVIHPLAESLILSPSGDESLSSVPH
jgi:hypothetical protein